MPCHVYKTVNHFIMCTVNDLYFNAFLKSRSSVMTVPLKMYL